MGKQMRNTFVMIFLALCAMMLGGCSSVPTVTDEAVVNEAKSFSPPAEGKAHVLMQVKTTPLKLKVNFQTIVFP